MTLGGHLGVQGPLGLGSESMVFVLPSKSSSCHWFGWVGWTLEGASKELGCNSPNQSKPPTQLFSDPEKKRTLFGETIFSGAATNKRGNRVPLNN